MSCKNCFHYAVCVKIRKPALYGIDENVGCEQHFKDANKIIEIGEIQMNHMAEVAKILGVELGQEFEVGLCRIRYILTEDGLFCASSGREANNMLKYLLTGEAEVKLWK